VASVTATRAAALAASDRSDRWLVVGHTVVPSGRWPLSSPDHNSSPDHKEQFVLVEHLQDIASLACDEIDEHVGTHRGQLIGPGGRSLQ
jgi:hypothetical protein